MSSRPTQRRSDSDVDCNRTATRCWEYRAVYLDRLDGVEADLDQLGDEGWELVSVAADYAYFKRSTMFDRTGSAPEAE